MAEVHLIQWTAAFAGALYLTSKWLLTRPESRWRHIVAGLIATILWIPIAYSAGNVGVADGGSTVVFGSEALGTFAIFMAVVNAIGLILGLFLWTEEAVDDASETLPQQMRRPGD